MNYTHLTRDERYQIAILRKAGHKQIDIAQLMNRHPSTISSELRRNRGQRGYRPKQAQELSEARMRACETGPRIPDETWAVVDEWLGELWSPEQITGRLSERGLHSVGHEASTIASTLTNATAAPCITRYVARKLGGSAMAVKGAAPSPTRYQSSNARPWLEHVNGSATGRPIWSSVRVINRRSSRSTNASPVTR